ncbi:MAG: cyclic nucleotide-binding domain-containing protein [bacterium]
MQYKTNSVIYFKGDVGDRVYILKSGRVSLTSTDVETGQEIHDYIQTGEFFGVKSALGKYPREENAVVLSDASVIMFTVPEFEELASRNTRIIMKMLKVFSNQLRRLHAKVRNLLAEEEQADPEIGLFQNGEYYLKKKHYAHALYAFRKYLEHYPSGRFADKAQELSQTAEVYAQKYGHGKGPGVPGLEASVETKQARKPEQGRRLSDAAKRYYDAVSVYSRQDYEEALGMFQEIARSASDQEYTLKALFEMGRCLYGLERYDSAIKHFTSIIQKYPKLTELPDALFHIGRSYQQKEDATRARSFYNKILSMPQVEEGLKRKVNKALRSLED